MLSVNYQDRDRRGFVSSVPKYARVGGFIRFMTNRSVCLTFVIILCSLSFMMSLFKFTDSPSPTTVNRRTLNSRDDAFRRSSQQHVKIREVMAIVKNEKDAALRNLNTDDIRNQGLLTLKTKQKKFKLYSAEGNKIQSSSVQKQEAEEQVTMYGMSGNVSIRNSIGSSDTVNSLSTPSVVLDEHTTSQNVLKSSPPSHPDQKVIYSLKDLREGTDKILKNSSFNSDLKQKSFSSPGHKLTNATDDKSYTDEYQQLFHEMISLDYSKKADPIRKSFLKNISKYVSVRKQRFHSYYAQDVKLLPKQTTGIIIVTNYRSGSTFLGELFNQHPDSFYIFEPLFPFTGGCGVRELVKTKLLHQLLKCDFPPMPEVYAQVKGQLRKGGEDIRCLTDDFCFRKNTKEMCEPSLCPLWKNRNCHKCGPLHLPRAMNMCRSKKMSVIKAIRLCDIMNLKPLMADPTMNFKIVHLIRDPRGIESSRMKIHRDWRLRSNAEETCARLLRNGQLGLANTSETKWLQDKYLKVRYEDLSLQPMKEAEKIYQFTGLDFLPQIKSWIAKNTKASGSSNPRNPYSTNRNSASVMEAWRKHLKFEDVDVVQNVCKKAMTFFDYLPVSSQAELLNFDIRLIT